MTPQEINIKIAEFLGIPFDKKDVCTICHGITPYDAGDDYGITIWKECDYCSNTGKVDPYYVGLPNYYGDLNAMHEAVKRLRKFGLLREYAKTLSCLNDAPWKNAINFERIEWERMLCKVSSATPAQCAEALYQTIITCPQT